MSYKVIVDSCGELTEEMKRSGHFVTAPLSIQVDDRFIVDDETFDQAEFLKLIAASPDCPKSSCPSPEKYMEYFDCDEERVYVVTLSSELSGSIIVRCWERICMRKNRERRRFTYSIPVQLLLERR